MNWHWQLVGLLTPSHHSKFEKVSLDIDIENSDYEKIDVEALQSHPAKRGQQGVVDTKSHIKAKPCGGQSSYCLAGEEVDVE